MPRPHQKSPSGEHALLARLGKILGPAAAAGDPWPLTLGDDAAIRLCRSNERMVVTADISVENVHFTTDSMSFAEIGFRTMASNVSDCAAMAAQPEAAIVQLVFPKEPTAARKTEALYRGFAEACRKWNFRLVGGDLSAGPCWTIGITLIGTVPKGCRPVTRRGIVPGDTLWLSGFPGRSAAGFAALRAFGRKSVPARYRSLLLQHIRPEPPVELGLALGRDPAVHAMMDLSDGISKDAATLCFENRLGLELSLDNLTPPDDLAALSDELGTPWQEWVLHGGEEYELLVAGREERGERKEERGKRTEEKKEGRGPESQRPEGQRPEVQLSNSRTLEHSNTRTLRRSNARTPERSNTPTLERSNSGMVRLGTFTEERTGVWVRQGGRLNRLAMKSWDHAGKPGNY